MRAPCKDCPFLSTPSARRATHSVDGAGRHRDISIHALREEGDHRRRAGRQRPEDFYPRPPRGGRPSKTSQIKSVKIYFYPRPPRGGRRILAAQCTVFVRISIHALREEGDAFPVPGGSLQGDFYPRPPRGGRPQWWQAFCLRHYFYPRPPRGGRHAYFAGLPREMPISIHALREEGDPRGHGDGAGHQEFLSTPSARRATSLSFASSNVSFDFYPRPPRGGRRGRSRQLHDGADFYPRPPRGGRPGYPAQALWPCRDFYPRPPRGGRRRPA